MYIRDNAYTLVLKCYSDEINPRFDDASFIKLFEMDCTVYMRDIHKKCIDFFYRFPKHRPTEYDFDSYLGNFIARLINTHLHRFGIKSMPKEGVPAWIVDVLIQKLHYTEYIKTFDEWYETRRNENAMRNNAMHARNKIQSLIDNPEIAKY
jgi:hypothetical protein